MIVLYDFLYPIFSPIRNCIIEIYDPFNYLNANISVDSSICYFSRLTPTELRLIGRTNAETIIIVTHVLNKVENGVVKEVALGVSPPSFLEYVLPIESYYLVKGRVGGEEVFGEDVGFLDYVCCIGNKTIVLVSCYKAGTDEILEKLREHGARVVYVKYTDTTRQVVEDVVSKVFSFKDPTKLCVNETAIGCISVEK